MSRLSMVYDQTPHHTFIKRGSLVALPGIQAGCKHLSGQTNVVDVKPGQKMTCGFYSDLLGTHFWTPSALRIGKPQGKAMMPLPAKAQPAVTPTASHIQGYPGSGSFSSCWAALSGDGAWNKDTQSPRSPVPNVHHEQNKLNSWFNLPNIWMVCYMAVYNLVQIFPIA